jgi:hypothetical protein
VFCTFDAWQYGRLCPCLKTFESPLIEATFFHCVFAGAELEALVERLEMDKVGGGEIGTQRGKKSTRAKG